VSAAAQTCGVTADDDAPQRLHMRLRAGEKLIARTLIGTPASAATVRTATALVPYTSAMHALVAGATGFIGGMLVRRLLADGAAVRALVRDRDRARARLTDDPRLELFVGDVLDRATLDGAGAGIDVAYYLVHSMGRGSDHPRHQTHRS